MGELLETITVPPLASEGALEDALKLQGSPM